MSALFHSPVFQDIGMTLLHSLWQIVLIAILFAIANRLLAHRSAHVRYVVAYSTLLIMFGLPIATLVVATVNRTFNSEQMVDVDRPTNDSHPAGEASEESASDLAKNIGLLEVEPTETSPLVAPGVAVASVPSGDADHGLGLHWILPWLTVGWSLGVIASSLRPFIAFYHCRQLRKQAQPVEIPWVIEVVASLCTRVEIHRHVEIASSILVQVPTVIGVVRPMILLPVTMVTGQTVPEFSAVIAHELAHIRRHDFLLNLFQTAIETLLFYHPAVWWVSSIVRQERENCCDDIAVAICGRKNYVTALANLEFARGTAKSMAMAADGGVLYRRIRRIVRPHERPHPLGRWLAALVAMTAILLGILTVLPKDAVAVGADEPREAKSVEEPDSRAHDNSANVEAGDARPDNAVCVYTGKVLSVSGQPIDGAKVYAENTRYDRHLKRQLSQEIAATLSAADGSYSLSVPPQNGLTQLIAAKAGYGPAIADFELLHELFKQGKSELDLQLVGESTITGHVVDTEGNPLSGITVHVDRVVLPRSEEAVAKWIADEQPEWFRRNDRNSILMDDDPRITNTAFPAAAAVRHGSAIPGDATTTADGRFRFDGLGENSLVRLTLSGPNIAKRQAIVVARQMKSIVAFADGVRDHDYTHYGASPTLVASPTQPIVGRVYDSQTKQPLPNMKVHLVRAGKEVWVHGLDNITTVTDADGRFELLGAPLGGQHVVEVHPPLDQPYFETQRELPVAAGSAPLECDFELPRTRWIRGRVTDEAGKPVVATLEFYPYRDNPHAEAFTKFDPKIAGKVPDDKVDSDENGIFRIKAIPGPAVLAAVAKDQDERLKFLPNRDDELLERIGGQEMRKVYNGWSADYFDALLEVNLPENAVEQTQDLVFKLGRTRTLHITDDAGRPLSEIHVIGRTFPPSHRLETLPNSSLDVIGLQPTESRLVVIMDEQRKLGTVLTVQGADSNPINVRLQPCAVVTGRVVSENGEGVENISIRASMIQEPQVDHWARELNNVQTDATGTFRVWLPLGGTCRIFSYSDQGPNFSAIIRPAPEVAYDLGDVKHDDELKESDTEKRASPIVGSTSAKPETPAVDDVAGSDDRGASHAVERQYAGQVLLPDGQPARGAEIFLIHWLPTPLKKIPMEPLAKTDVEGRFQFAIQKDPFGEAAWGTIVAKLDGYSFGWAVAPALEVSDESAKRLAEAPPQIQEMLQRDRGPIRLLADDAPITGRIVDTEGNGVADVSVYLSEVLGGSDNTMAAWDRVLNETAPDQLKLQEELVRTLRGPGVPTLFGDMKTDAAGRFTIRGLGRNRVVKIMMEGTDIVAESIHARTSGGKTVLLPMQASSPGSGFETTYHGNDFTLVAQRARPVVGRVTDQDGKGVAGVIVTSVRALSQTLDSGGLKLNYSGSDIVLATSDAEGKYRLNGLPISPYNTLHVSSPLGSNYLPATSFVDTSLARDVSRRHAPVTKDLTLQRGLVVEGRVIDSATNLGVAGQFRFVRNSQDEGIYTASMAGSQIQRTQADGAFRILVPPSPGFLTFTAFDQHKYRMAKREVNATESVLKIVDGDVIRFGTADLVQGHAVYAITGTEEEPLPLELNLIPASVVTGHAVNPQGERLTTVFYTGQSMHAGHWTRTANGQLDLYDVDAKQLRRVGVFHRAQELAGIHTPQSADAPFEVKLQPWATVRGRIVNAEGAALAGVTISSGTRGPAIQTFASPSEAMKLKDNRDRPLLLPPHDEIGNSRYATDKDGRFEIVGLIPGETYHLDGQYEQKHPMSLLVNAIARDLTLKPGEERDIGDIVLKPAEPTGSANSGP